MGVPEAKPAEEQDDDQNPALSIALRQFLVQSRDAMRGSPDQGAEEKRRMVEAEIIVVDEPKNPLASRGWPTLGAE